MIKFKILKREKYLLNLPDKKTSFQEIANHLKVSIIVFKAHFVLIMNLKYIITISKNSKIAEKVSQYF
jgi:hypothetical protein